MRHLQTRIVLLIVCLGAFYGLEQLARLDGSQAETRLFTGIAVTLAVILILLVPASGRRVTLYAVLAGGVVYSLARLVVLPRLSDNAQPSNLEVYTDLTELAFLALLAGLAYLVADSLAEFRESVAYVTFESAGGRPANVDDSREQIQTEITRSRHYQRPLSVIAVEMDGVSAGRHTNWTVAQAQAKLAARYANVALANEVRQATRSIDLVLEAEKDGALLILCPEADQETADALAERVSLALHQSGVNARCAAATFPDEGLTFGALAAQAQAQLHSEQAPATLKAGNVVTTIRGSVSAKIA